jgi:hypothetical protein
MTGVGVEEQCALGDRRRCIQVPAVVEADDRFHDRDAPNRTRAMATTGWPGQLPRGQARAGAVSLEIGDERARPSVRKGRSATAELLVSWHLDRYCPS